MKKILASLAMVGLLAAPVLAFAVMGLVNECTIAHLDDMADYSVCDVTDPETIAACCLIDKILTVGDWLFVIILVAAVIIILIAAFQFLTAAGSPDKVASARNSLIYALIGVAVAFLAKVLVRVIASIIA